ncbi:hypothetical protein BD779DRAFT_1392564, partial [Infundibulicybe gibba]
LPAARKICGFSACTHQHFCTVCSCTRKTHGFGNFDLSSWKRRTNEECRSAAEKFRTASSSKAATIAFDSTGLRWSQLLRLPYFDISRFVVIDSMHNLFLGLIKEHFRAILGYKPTEDAPPDLEGTVKASWVTSVPTSLFNQKLKSDQWRTMGSLYMPLTLVRLWSTVDEASARSKRRGEILQLTMSLLSAIAIATSRVTTPENAKNFNIQMTNYRRDLQRLFPTYQAHPNHHMAMHISEYLLMYGPVHGWWTFPFERMIGMLQRIETN